MSAITGGLTFGVAKEMIASCVDNGIDPDDPRVMRRSNEATKLILDSILPVGGMATFDVQATGDIVTLPKYLENAIDVEVRDGAKVRGSGDNAQAFYDVISQATYVDPALAHDNPMVDQGLVTERESQFNDGIVAFADFNAFISATANFTADDVGSLILSGGIIPGTKIASIVSPAQVVLDTTQAGAVTQLPFTIEKRTTLVRRYTYPGLQPNAVVRVTGAKRFLPITSDADFMIVQNIEALKLMILSIERYENNSPADGKTYRDMCLELLTNEVKKHIHDPRNLMRRKARYEDDVAAYARGTFGWTRARIALEVPGAMLLGKSEIGRLLGDAEMRLMERVPMARGCVKEYSANVTSGRILFPGDVDSILGAVMCGVPLDIRSITFKYLENGPGDVGCCGGCGSYLEDEGEEYFPTSKTTRRKFRLTGISDTDAARLVFACKVRYVDKKPADQMTIKHYPSLSLMTQAIIMERNEKWNEAGAGIQAAIATLELDLDSYLKGIKMTIPIETYGFGMGDVGGML